jgi:cytochrome P450
MIIVIYWFRDPLRPLPGPKLYRLTKWRLALDDFRASRTRTIHALHAKYGPAVRIGPSEVSFASLSAVRQIYGAGSGFERSVFYSMFDVYGRQNLFTFASAEDHRRRKKMLHHAYSKSVILNNSTITSHVGEFLKLVQKQPVLDVYSAVLFYSLDNITEFLYGAAGGTHALSGDESDQKMLDDQRDPARRKLTWFSTHARWYVQWLSRQTGATAVCLDRLGMYPQRKPFVYTGIREHALKSANLYEMSDDQTIIGRLKKYNLDSLDVASECADHFLAGINTTSDTLLFLFWILSRPENSSKQERLIQELRSAVNGPSPKDINAAHTPYFDAIIHETLRLYAPLPASEPRVNRQDTEIDGYFIPAGTIVSSQVYTLHRNPDVFNEPDSFMPERWLSNDPEMKRWWWAFSSGGRMCIGEQY